MSDAHVELRKETCVRLNVIMDMIGESLDYLCRQSLALFPRTDGRVKLIASCEEINRSLRL